MQFPKAVFRAPGPEMIDGVGFTSSVVNDEDQLAAAKGDGWHETPADAHQAHQDAEAQLAEAKQRAAVGDDIDNDDTGADDTRPPTRPELEAKAKELGIGFKPQTSNKKLAELIEAKLAEAKQ